VTKVGAVLLVAVVLFGACAGSEDLAEPTDAPRTLEPTPTKSATTVDAEVNDGKVIGGLKRVKVPLNDQVRLSVRSDVADEVHVHGYDVKRDIPAGGGLLMTFVADVPGVFVVELEQHQLHIVELEVR
jgi:heme/copper-type cytochrome/quinol oxidase subunit 2